jgi:uncharacterized coiled-coil DUF342 family protein
MSADPNSLPKFLAAQIALTDNALKSLGEFRGALDALASRAAEVEALKEEIPKLKAQATDLKVQIAEMWSEYEQVKQRLAELNAKVSVPATLFHELQTKFKSV